MCCDYACMCTVMDTALIKKIWHANMIFSFYEYEYFSIILIVYCNKELLKCLKKSVHKVKF